MTGPGKKPAPLLEKRPKFLPKVELRKNKNQAAKKQK